MVNAEVRQIVLHFPCKLKFLVLLPKEPGALVLASAIQRELPFPIALIHVPYETLGSVLDDVTSSK